MPFIKGRYHINPIAGQALEAAREAEAALLALEHAAQQNRESDADSGADADSDAPFASRFDRDASRQNDAAPGPIHRVEIDAAETVPSNFGHATRGFVARVHRAPVVSPAAVQSAAADPRAASSSLNQSPAPETHVFAGHRDLISFLRDEFAKDCAR